jgi:hypothetical protein
MAGRFTLALVAAALLVPAPARAAKVDPADGITYGAMYLYLQGFQAGSLGPGATLGGYFAADWNDTTDQMKTRPFAIGFITEAAFGFGAIRDARTAGYESTGFLFDLTADILGIAARYRLFEHAEVGLFYEPVEAVVSGVGWFLGSKLELKLGYRAWQLELARGADGFGYGAFVPSSGGVIYTAAVHYRAPSELMYGVRYSKMAPESSAKDSAHALMVFFGYWY